MDFRPVTIDDKAIFNHYLTGREYRLITYCFTNFYLWRNWDPYRWTLAEEALVVKSDYLGLDAVLCPISPDDNRVLAATEALIDWYRQRGVPFLMCEVDQDMLALFEARWPGRFQADEYPPGANYIYEQQDLALLPGKRYNTKRNHIRRFIRDNPDYRFLPLTADLVEGCQAELQTWFARHDHANFEIVQEYQGVADGLAHLEQLDFFGAALLAQGRVAAFALGERLNRDTCCIHIEKADVSIAGSYQAINNFFARDLCRDFRYINRAEDMDDVGLRHAKQSYHPCRLEKKYNLRLKLC